LSKLNTQETIDYSIPITPRKQGASRPVKTWSSF